MEVASSLYERGIFLKVWVRKNRACDSTVVVVETEMVGMYVVV